MALSGSKVILFKEFWLDPKLSIDKLDASEKTGKYIFYP